LGTPYVSSAPRQPLSSSGVFSAARDPRVERFTESVSFDARLVRQDIQGSLAHAQMLAAQGLLTAAECQQIRQALHDILGEVESGRFTFRPELEDVHMNIEQALIDRLGDVGRKLHTARSRNDQVATDLRLWVREAIDAVDDRLAGVQRALVRRCDVDFDVVLPGYTHLQRAQPVLAAHVWLAHCERLQRDRQRLADARRRTNVLPLGSAALAGTSLPVDRAAVAATLKFDDVAANSLDATSDRDFVLEFAFCLSMVALHLSGWAEEWILWSTCEFGFLRLPEAFCTGSSIMPQKINPDVLELIRGKASRVVGSLMSLCMLIKSLPLGYHRDLQEDKRPLFEAYDLVRDSLELAVPIIEGAELNRAAIDARLDEGHLDATALMEHMIGRGIPQRTAHGLVGTLVRRALDRGVRLSDLTLAEFQEVHPQLDASVYNVLGARRALESLRSYGSSAPHEVAQQVARWKQRLAMP
jgi:argininosuccinate lyase